MNLITTAAAGVIIAAVSFGVGYWRGDTAGAARVQSQWDAEKAKQMAEYAKAQAEAREREQQLQQQADSLREEKRREVQAIASRNDALVRSLRQRPERPAEGSTVPGAASACSGASGAQLSRGDGEFLVRLAADAARLQSALDSCIRQYEALRVK